MAKNFYQIDRRDGNGKLDGYVMVQADNMVAAAHQYLGSDFKDYILKKQYVNGKQIIKATCEIETAGYLEISKAGGK